jgi:putative endonuclease
MTGNSESKDKIGRLGEQLVSQWLQQKRWTTLYHRWRCRWGEIDVIARKQSSDLLAFVEIKTRGRGNWDEDGILAITPQKQTKLCHAAGLFLASYPDLAELSCRFDVALVSYKTGKTNSSNDLQAIAFNQPIFLEGYQLTLHRYLEAAFECC